MHRRQRPAAGSEQPRDAVCQTADGVIQHVVGMQQLFRGPELDRLRVEEGVEAVEGVARAQVQYEGRQAQRDAEYQIRARALEHAPKPFFDPVRFSHFNNSLLWAGI